MNLNSPIVAMLLYKIMVYRRYMGLYRASVFHILIWTLATLVAADVVVSYIGITWFGATEGNPLYYLMGWWGFMLLKVAVSAGAMWMMWRLRDTYASWVSVGMLCGLYWVVLVNNLVVMTRG